MSSSSLSLKTILARYLPIVEDELQDLLASTGAPYTDYYGMIHYHMGWVDANLQPSHSQTGKRVRPIICLLACEAAGGAVEQALPAAAGIETVHNFSLLHDDIEDNSDTRRGRTTVWKLWGAAQGINAGDGMFVLAHLAFCRLPSRGVPAERALEALKFFDQTCLKLTQGQHLDIRFEDQALVTVEEYLAMISGKTAALLAASTYLGAFLAGVDQTTAQRYHDFGHHLGLAFQIQDDILGIWGEEELTGKSTSDDIMTRKKTLPVLLGLGQSKGLRAIYAAPEMTPERAQQVVEILNELDVRTAAEELATRHHQKSLAALKQSGASGQAGQALRALADSLLKRSH
jgi:geranylgeranyl diphosphate synthase type I